VYHFQARENHLACNRYHNREAVALQSFRAASLAMRGERVHRGARLLSGERYVM